MSNSFYDKKPLGEGILREIAKKRVVETPRNNLLLQLGRTDSHVLNRDEVQRDYVNFDSCWQSS